jgi:hypothetical protein
MASFVVKVLINGRHDPIQSPPYDSREAAEADLERIGGALDQEQTVDLRWLKIHGPLVQGAYLEANQQDNGDGLEDDSFDRLRTTERPRAYR